MSQMPINVPCQDENGLQGDQKSLNPFEQTAAPNLSAFKINGVLIKDTFAEAFGMTATRLIITAINHTWAKNAADSVTGYATSIIGCGVEAGIEQLLEPTATPDDRPGISVLVFAMNTETLGKKLIDRVGQAIMTCPTTAVFGGLGATDRVLDVGKNLRYFGDGHQISKKIGNTRYWRIPVMDGEFVCENTVYATKAVGGGNFLVMARDILGALQACEAAVRAIRQIPGCIAPFPGGVVRSGSKVGSRYPTLRASTNDRYCPTIREVVETDLPPEAGACLEVVIDGLTPDIVAHAMRVGIRAACEKGEEWGILEISAGNYGGKLGPHHFHLHKVLSETASD